MREDLYISNNDCIFADVNETRSSSKEPLSHEVVFTFMVTQRKSPQINIMNTIICPHCGAQILGKPKCERDEHGNLYQIIDYTCSCGYGRIDNPNM